MHKIQFGHRDLYFATQTDIETIYHWDQDTFRLQEFDESMWRWQEKCNNNNNNNNVTTMSNFGQNQEKPTNNCIDGVSLDWYITDE